MVVVSHASNVIGLVAPVEEIFSVAKKYGAFTVVDMAQTAGLCRRLSFGKSFFGRAVGRIVTSFYNRIKTFK